MEKSNKKAKSMCISSKILKAIYIMRIKART